MENHECHIESMLYGFMKLGLFSKKTLWYPTKEIDVIVSNNDLELGKAWKQGHCVNIIQVGLFIHPS